MQKLSFGFMFLLVTTLNLASVPALATPPMKEWTLLVYLNGHNNLDKFGIDDINEMEQVGSTDQTNVVVQWASLRDSAQTKRLYVTKDSDNKKITSSIVEALPRVDMGDYRSLVEFVRWGMKNYPAKRYFVDIWNHGGGWHLQSLSVNPQDISWDDLSNNVIKTEQLGLAMEEIQKIRGSKIDVLGFDACLMAMGEVLTEVEDSVQYVVGSQELEPGPGWPYGDFLGGMNQLNDASPANVLNVLTTEYLKSYSGGSQGTQTKVTLSAFDLSYLSPFKNSIRSLGSLMRTFPSNIKAAVKSVLKASTAFNSGADISPVFDYVDAGDFVSGLRKEKLIGDSIEFASVKNALDRLVISNKTSAYYKRATGLSIWFPRDWSVAASNAPRYKNLKFNQETDWLPAVQYILQ